jgi:hypothetical protein
MTSAFTTSNLLSNARSLMEKPLKRLVLGERWTMREGWAVGRWSVKTAKFRHLELPLTRLFLSHSFASCNLVRDTCHISVQASHTSSTYVKALSMNTQTTNPNLVLPVAAASEGLPRQRFHIALYKIHPHIHKQNPMSRERRHCEPFLFESSCNLMPLVVDARRPPHTDGFHERGVHGLERVNVQL